ncbi:MAG: ABC transporter substrate-binding protein [Treponema sp.]|nr:ABC transporter substrate-binding protein [Treponema sp.]
MKSRVGKIIPVLFATSLAIFVFCECTKKKVEDAESKKVNSKIIASTSWTAAFADLAGLDNVDIIAPANLRHPPEYEVTVSDIQKISDSDVFIFAGFERMMKTLGDSIEGVNMIKITCDNSIETVLSQANKIAEIMGSQEEAGKRVAEYVAAVEKGRKAVEDAGLAGAKVYCNKNQTYLAKDLGFEIAAVFGPGPASSDQIALAKEEDFAFIIDNIHNPTGTPLAEVSDAKYIIWRNFPEKVERKALQKVVEENIKTIF